jgi:dTMP kinase
MSQINNVKQQGRLIVLDGVDGCGKTTIAKFLQEELNHHHIPNVLLRAIGQGIIGNAVREQYLHGELTNSPTAEALFVASSIIEAYEHSVVPALKEGKTVILDRSIGSYYAYQVAYGINSAANTIFFGMLLKKDIIPPPDLYLFLDVDLATSVERMATRPNQDNFDKKSLSFKDTAIKAYDYYFRCLSMCDNERIDARHSIDVVKETVLKQIDNRNYFEQKLLPDYINSSNTINHGVETV